LSLAQGPLFGWNLPEFPASFGPPTPKAVAGADTDRASAAISAELTLSFLMRLPSNAAAVDAVPQPGVGESHAPRRSFPGLGEESNRKFKQTGESARN